MSISRLTLRRVTPSVSSGTILKTVDGGATWLVQPEPSGKDLNGVHFPVDATTGYAVGQSGTILKTVDGGATWLVQPEPSGKDLNGVHFPVDATTGYAVGDGGTILKTVDGGATSANADIARGKTSIP